MLDIIKLRPAMKQKQNRPPHRSPQGKPEHDCTYAFRCPKSLRTAINKAGGSIFARRVLAEALGLK